MQIINVMAASLDGKIGHHRLEGDDERVLQGLSSAADQEGLFQRMRTCDAIVVGAGSIRSNRKCLALPDSDTNPHWYILARQPIPPEWSFWQQRNMKRTLIGAQLPTHSQDVETIDPGLENFAVFTHRLLQSRGYKRVLLFGGGLVNREFYRQDLVDELHLSVAPLFIGLEQAPVLVQPPLDKPVKFKLLASQAKENFVFLEYAVSPNHA